jgi:hypothetical protein
MHVIAELGFIVVQLDGMGTNIAARPSTTSAGRTQGRGFPDRIAGSRPPLRRARGWI